MANTDKVGMLARMGGRKQTNGYIAAVLLTGMAWPLQATYAQYTIALLTALGFHTAAVAWEDHKKRTTEAAAGGGVQGAVTA